MLRTKLYLTDAKALGETAIYAACYLGGQRKKLYFPTLTVKPEQWDTKGQRYRRSFPNFANANHLLKKLIDALEEAYVRITAKGQATSLDDLRAVAARVVDNIQPASPVGFAELMEHWIENARRDKSHSTIKAYGTMRQHLVNYAKARRLRLDFAAMNEAFCEGFKTYLLKDAGLGNASINNQIKNLKVFLGSTYEGGYHEIADYKKFRKLAAILPDVVYLTRAELERVTALQLSHLPYLEEVRDVFLVECETGLRYSDIAALRSGQIYDGYAMITTQKTAELLRVPLSPLARTILTRYKGRADGLALPVRSNQKTNAHLKTIAKLARIDVLITTTQHKGSERLATTRPKYELIGTHTARRTFVSLALEGGMRPEAVMKITGHKDIKMLHRYLKVSDDAVDREFEQYVERQAKGRRGD